MRTSLAVMRSFLERREDGSIDASGVNSRACYVAWLRLQQQRESDSEAKKFQRTLLNHVSGVDGRSPFEKEEEAAILLVIRRKQRWECFPAHLTIGYAGFRSRGFHEKAAVQKLLARTAAAEAEAAPPSPPPKEPESDGDFVTSFARAVFNLTKSLVTLDVPSWVYVGNLIRFVVFARTPVCQLAKQDEGYAARLCEQVSANNPGQVVVVMDFLAKDYSTAMVLAHNRESLACFGDLFALQNTTPPFKLADLPQFVMAVSNAFHQPGVAFPVTKLRFNCSNGQQVAFNGVYTVCPLSYLLLLIGRPSGL